MSAKQYATKNAKSVSNAEWTLRSTFEQLGIVDGSFQNDDFPFTPEICTKYDTLIRGTNIDRHYPDYRLAIFFDGPHHLKERQEKKDDLIDEILKHEFHYIIKRYKFSTMTKARAILIAQDVRATLEAMGYQVDKAPKISILKCGFCEDDGKEELFVDDADHDALSEIHDHMWKDHCMSKVKKV